MENEKKYCIYKIVDLRNDQIVYVGKTCNFKHRKTHHFTQDKQPVQKYMLEEDRTNFEMSIIEDNIKSNEEAVRIEDEYIVDLQPIMNKNRSGNIYKDDPNRYIREAMKEYYKKSEKYREHQKEYHSTEKWKDYHKDYNKDYRESHKDYYKEYKRQWWLKKKLDDKKQDGLF